MKNLLVFLILFHFTKQSSASDYIDCISNFMSQSGGNYIDPNTQLEMGFTVIAYSYPSGPVTRTNDTTFDWRPVNPIFPYWYGRFVGSCSETILEPAISNTADNNPTDLKNGNKNICPKNGSIINPSKKTVSESIPIDGTSAELVYSSEFNSNRVLNRSVYQEIILNEVNSFPKQIKIFSESSSRTLVYESSPNSLPLSSLKVFWPWDEAQNNLSTHPALNKAKFYYETNYAFPSSANMASGSGVQQYISIYAPRIGPEIVTTSYPTASSYLGFHIYYGTQTVSVYHPEVWGLAGWTISLHHFFDRESKTLFKGNGEKVDYALFRTLTLSGLGTVDLVSRYEDDEVYIFNLDGEHLETRSKVLGKTLYKFTYDNSHKLISFSDKFNKTTQLIYNNNGTLIRIEAPYGQQTQFTLNNNLITHISDSINNSYTIQYDADRFITQFTKPNNEVTTFAYDNDGNFISESKNTGLIQAFTAVATDTGSDYTYSTATGLKTITHSNLSNRKNYTYFNNNNDENIYYTVDSDNEHLTYDFYANRRQSIYISEPTWGSTIDFNSYTETYAESYPQIINGVKHQKQFVYDNPADPTTLATVQEINGSADRISVDNNLLVVAEKKIYSFNEYLPLLTKTFLDDNENVTRVEPALSYPIDLSYDNDGRLTQIQKDYSLSTITMTNMDFSVRRLIQKVKQLSLFAMPKDRSYKKFYLIKNKFYLNTQPVAK